jgi:hypothetical protein
MKTATASISRTIAVIVTLVLFLGAASTASAGDATRIVRSHHAGHAPVMIKDTGATNVPRPVADETPVNPELFKNSTPDKSSPTADSNRAPVKRTIRPR